MTYHRTAPPRALAGLIESFSYWAGGARSPDRMRVTASRNVSLQIDLADDRLCWYDCSGAAHALRGIAVAGPQSRSFAVDAWQPKIVRVVFRPAGARRLLGMSPHALRDLHVSLEDLWGAAAGRLHTRLVDAAEPAAIFHTLADVFGAIAACASAVHPAVAYALDWADAEPDLTVAALARHVEVGPKRLIRLFADDVGITPKLYLRLARFERLLANIYPAPAVDWAAVAHDHGYYDQSHLIHDFREFGGMTPAAYLVRRGPAEHHARG